MIHDLMQGLPESTMQPADVCIVGAGAAGIVLAVELVRQGKRVLMLEGGGPGIEDASQEPYRSEITGLPHNGVHIGRFRAKGGTTTRWGGQILELDDADFTAREWVPGSGWPFPKQELAPYYARAIALEGLARATLSDEAVWRELNLQSPFFTELEPFFSRWCPEPDFSRLHRNLLENSSQVDLWLHANAIALVREGPKILGVKTRTLSGIETIFRADRFVFALGGIESCRFFLQPEEAEKPWNRSGLLGRHFQDHIIAPAATLEPLNAATFHNIFDNIFHRGFKYQPKLRLSPSVQAQQRTLNVAAMILYKGDTEAIAGQLKITARKLLGGKWRQASSSELFALLRHSPLLARQIYRYSVKHRAYVAPRSRIELGVHTEQDPLSRSSITLSETRDSLGMLRTRLDWHVSNNEIDSIRAFVKVAQRSLSSIARVVPDPDLDSYDRFRLKCGDNYHHMGGMRVSSSPSDGVVDLNLRLHGMENGYVCSAAVYPNSGFSNPTHTLLALAVRLADHLSPI
ncbi:GMC family oxidoreductase [Edaphobacter modestus]|nr:GMC family oxidoreductase [Edaphobacter modestus]